MTTATGALPGCICPTAIYPSSISTASAEKFWKPSELGIRASMFLLTYIIAEVAPSCHAQVFQMDDCRNDGQAVHSRHGDEYTTSGCLQGGREVAELEIGEIQWQGRSTYARFEKVDNDDVDV